jgi:hypothetical protein
MKCFLVDYIGRLFREGTAMISREVAEIFERIGTTAVTWQARLEKPSEDRLLGRFPDGIGLSAWRQFSARRGSEKSRSGWVKAGPSTWPVAGSPEAGTKPVRRPVPRPVGDTLR